MRYRRFLAAIVFATSAAFLIAQMPADLAGQTAKEKKAALLKKKLQEAKEAARPAPEPAKPVAKVAPAETKPAQPMDVKAVAKFIDAEINKKLAEAKIKPSARSSDAEFVRRVSLDIAGVIPSADRVTAFIDSSDADKRAKLIDELLASPKFGERLADTWATQMYPIESTNRFLTKAPLHKYLAETFNANKPWDQMAREIITAEGEVDKLGAVTYFAANQGVDKITDSIGKLFLGVQIQCANCHNHPFTHWKQVEYWGLAQFFYNVNINAPRNGKDKDTTVSVSETARPNRRFNPLPESAKSVKPKLLGANEVSLSSSKPYRPVLADWMCTSDNPFFSKAKVNRVWAQYFGKGIVNPIDDLSDENEPSHPELLNGLAKEFSRGGFDLKNLVRAICLSDAYQRTSQPTPENKEDKVLYSRMEIKVLSPEQLYDSLMAVTGGFEGGRPGPAPKAKGGPVTPRDRFVQFFMGSENPKATDYEAGIPQALRLMNNPRLSGSPALLNEISKAGNQPNKVIERIYLMTVSRRPTEAETKRLTEYVAKASDAKTGYGDILWVLLNSSEFALNH
jgi:Protein of unknown function (DUF1549)/Protein of unknown function (DUF1553)